MGRKPNPLILEFFERGAKLDDQSNRYEHTCKRCGMFFPKGRPDSMNRHLFEKCPNVSDYDRARALAFAQGQMNAEQIAQRLGVDYDPQARRTPHAPIPAAYPADQQQMTDSEQTLLAGLNRETSALDTLAEVSRQHLDLTRQRQLADAQAAAQQEVTVESQQEVDSWMVQLSQKLAQANAATEGEGGVAAHNEALDHVSHTDAVPLVQTANAANLLQASLERSDKEHVDQPRAVKRQKTKVVSNGNLDPSLRSEQDLQDASEHEAVGDDSNSNINHDMDANYVFGQLSMHQHEFDHPNDRGYGLLSRPLKRQRRTKFSEEGRAKVGDIRKLGACLRCRMLKKPCSGETPCAACNAIGTPRIWRSACIRTRIADEFTLYNAGYFSRKARETSIAFGADKLSLQRMEHNVEVAIFTEANARLSLPVDALIDVSKEPKLDGDLNIEAKLEDHRLTMKPETKDRAVNIEGFLFSNQEAITRMEPMRLIQNSIAYLRAMDMENDRDVLIGTAIKLWAATCLLAASPSFEWNLTFIGKSSKVLDSTSPNFMILQAQVLDLVERFAAQAFRSVANDLERRLLARATSTPLTTFLVTVILLNCIERISLFYRRLDNRDSTNPDTGAQDEDGVPDEWTFPRTPAEYFRQGTHFADLLTMLLKMRNLPPRTVARDDDSLAVVKMMGRKKWAEVLPLGLEDSDERVHGEDEGKKEYLRLVATWLGECGISGRDLWDRRCMSDDNFEGDWRAWDLRFGSMLVLPEGYGGYAEQQHGALQEATQEAQPGAQEHHGLFADVEASGGERQEEGAVDG